MATNYNITQKQYNGTDYDTLYPKNTSQQVLLNDSDLLEALGLGTNGNANDAFAELVKSRMDKVVIQKITSSQTWIAPKAAFDMFEVWAVGGGGSSGSARLGSNNKFSGAGGGGSGYIQHGTFTIPENTSVSIVVGAGGSAVTDASSGDNTGTGNIGGTTTFGSYLTAEGGKPGVNGTRTVAGNGGNGEAGGGGGLSGWDGINPGNGGNGSVYGGGGASGSGIDDGATSDPKTAKGGNGGTYGGGGAGWIGGTGGTYGGNGGSGSTTTLPTSGQPYSATLKEQLYQFDLQEKTTTLTQTGSAYAYCQGGGGYGGTINGVAANYYFAGGGGYCSATPVGLASGGSSYFSIGGAPWERRGGGGGGFMDCFDTVHTSASHSGGGGFFTRYGATQHAGGDGGVLIIYVRAD